MAEAKGPKKTVKLFNGYEMPLVGLGTWQAAAGVVEKAVKLALEAGYRHIDCAPAYGNEKEIGNAIAESKVDRKEIFLTSKLWNTFHRPQDVEPAIRSTLANLGTEYVDLWLMHWPHAAKSGAALPFPLTEDMKDFAWDDIPITETWKAMESLVDKGLARSIGVSNFTTEQIEEILKIARIQPAVNQVEIHAYHTQQPLLEYCRSKKIALSAYSPLGSPERPWAGKDEPNLLADPKLAKIATKYKKSVAQVLLRYQIEREVIVLPKSASAERIRANLQIFDFELTKEDFAEVHVLNRNLNYFALTKDEWRQKMLPWIVKVFHGGK